MLTFPRNDRCGMSRGCAAMRGLCICVLIALAGCGDSTSDSNAGTDAATGADTTDAGHSDFPTPVADDCISDVDAGSHVFTCGELEFAVRVPDICLREACGVILDVHGWFMNGEARAYSLNLLNEHEVVNDRFGDTAVAVVW